MGLLDSKVEIVFDELFNGKRKRLTGLKSYGGVRPSVPDNVNLITYDEVSLLIGDAVANMRIVARQHANLIAADDARRKAELKKKSKAVLHSEVSLD